MLAIQGYYGFGNLGDDLMLYLLLEQLAKRGIGTSYRVLHNIIADARLIRIPEGLKVERQAIGGWKERFTAIRPANALIYGGGTCLHRFGSCGFYNNLAAKALGKKVVWLAIGADDVGHGKPRLKAKMMLKLCDAASFRDAPSQTIVRELSPKFAPLAVHDDMVFLIAQSELLSPRIERARSSSGLSLLLGWRDFSGYLDHARQQLAIQNAAESVVRLTKQYAFEEITILDIADLVDQKANEHLADAITQRVEHRSIVQHLSGLTMEEKLETIAGADFALFARLHGLMLAKLIGLPAIGIAYASKLVNFSEHLDRPVCLGLAEFLEQPQRLQKMMQSEIESPARFQKPLKQHVESASRHIDFLANALAGRSKGV